MQFSILLLASVLTNALAMQPVQPRLGRQSILKRGDRSGYGGYDGHRGHGGHHGHDDDWCGEWESVRSVVDNLEQAMLASVRVTWEHGVATDALIERHYPDLSIFGSSPFTYNGVNPVRALSAGLSSVVKSCPDGRVASTCEDTSQLDGCSAGQGVLLGARTHGDGPVDWNNRTELLLDFMLNRANRTANGAISHKTNEGTLWNDGTYMLAGFLSSYALVHDSFELLNFTYNQIELYRDSLFNEDYQLWAHILNDNPAGFSDPGIWATGNGWALGGLLRLKSAILKSSHRDAMKTQTDNLLQWSLEIIDGFTAHLAENGLVRNFLDVPQTDPSAFGDSAGSALMAYGIYRLAVLVPDVITSEYLATADDLRRAVVDHVTDLGEMDSAVDVLNWRQKGIVSTEANAFAIMMLSAWRDLTC